jgi:hypothetical protein
LISFLSWDPNKREGCCLLCSLSSFEILLQINTRSWWNRIIKEVWIIKNKSNSW